MWHLMPGSQMTATMCTWCAVLGPAWAPGTAPFGISTLRGAVSVNGMVQGKPAALIVW